MEITKKRRDIAANTMRRNATKHGLASGKTKSTYYLCKSILDHQPPWFQGDDSEPSVCEEWLDLVAFVTAVIAEIGPRPCRHYKLAAVPDLSYLLDLDASPPSVIMKPGFIEWVLPPPSAWPKTLPPHPMTEWEVYVIDQRMWVRPKVEPPVCPAVAL